MKALVTYLSRTGNTKKVAEAIFGELECEKDIRGISEIDNLEGYDIIFAGFPVWQFGPAEPASEFLHGNCEGKNIAIFVTHAMDYEMDKSEDSKLLKAILEKCRKCASGGNLVGFFHCRGELDKNIADFLLNSTNLQMQRFGKSRIDTMGHPDDGELDVARLFAREVMSDVSVLYG